MKHKNLVIVLALLMIMAGGTGLARSADAATPTAAPVSGTLAPLPLLVAIGAADGGVATQPGCTAEPNCPAGSTVSTTGNPGSEVSPLNVKSDANLTDASCYHPECSNPNCECDCYATYGYGSGLVRCLTNCSINCQ
jgi:hypothetical protein